MSEDSRFVVLAFCFLYPVFHRLCFSFFFLKVKKSLGLYGSFSRICDICKEKQSSVSALCPLLRGKK